MFEDQIDFIKEDIMEGYRPEDEVETESETPKEDAKKLKQEGIQAVRQSLPVYKEREKFLKMVEENQVWFIVPTQISSMTIFLGVRMLFLGSFCKKACALVWYMVHAILLPHGFLIPIRDYLVPRLSTSFRLWIFHVLHWVVDTVVSAAKSIYCSYLSISRYPDTVPLANRAHNLQFYCSCNVLHNQKSQFL